MLVKTTAAADPPAAVDGPASHKNSDNDVSRAVTDVSSASAKEQHRCQWVGCDETFTEAQFLYEHLLEKHSDWPVGSVPLLCWWEPCEHFSKNPQHMRSHLLSPDLPTVQTSSKIMFRRGLKTVKTGTQMCEI
jgi:hypothetical protein